MILFTGGGTCGHLLVALAIRDELDKLGIKSIYVGSLKGQEYQRLKDDEVFLEKYFLASSGVVNKKGLSMIFSLFKIFKLVFTCFKIFKKHKITKVFSVGGFSSAPASIAAVILAKDLYIHEQNFVLGSLNYILRPFSKEFYSSYYSKSKIKDYPIREEFFNLSRVRGKIKTIMFLGGSNGALAINNFAIILAPILDKKGIKIIHQTGEKHFLKFKEKYENLKIKAEVFGFCANLEEYFSKADLAISRSGAGSVWELSANGLVSLFVPYPYAYLDHQYKNAKFLKDKGLAWVLREDDLSVDFVLDILDKNLEDMSKTLLKIINKDGAKNIALDLVN